MNTKIIFGRFLGTPQTYRSKNGQHYFKFEFVSKGNYFVINCKVHPSLNGRDSNVEKTHLYSSGNICFVEGKEPRSFREAEKRAAQWAEYFLEYRKTGIAQS